MTTATLAAARPAAQTPSLIAPRPGPAAGGVAATLGVLGVPGQINLDFAATAPCLRAAADAVNDLLPWYASVHRGAGALSQRCTLAYEQARQTVADFLGCGPEHHVIFTRNTTDALNLLAHALPPQTSVVTFAGEHHANLLPWAHRRDGQGTAVRLPVPASPGEAVRSLAAALRELRRTAAAPTRSDTAAARPILVAVTGASNVTGELWPVAELARVAHRYGALIALDAAQLVPHEPVDITALDVDFVAISGHKLYAPFGAGVLAGRADWLDAAPPYLVGGGASAHVGAATHDVRWATGPGRHEAGTPNLLGAVALAAAADALGKADRVELHVQEQALLTRLRAGLAELPRVAELRTFDAGAPRVGIVSFAVAGRDSAEIAAVLAEEHGIGVRDGLFCAHPLARRLLTEAAARTGLADLPPTALRASIGLGSTVEHIDRLLAALSSC